MTTLFPETPTLPGPPRVLRRITFEVSGDPMPQPRVRAFARKMGNGQAVARVYTPGTAEAWKSAIAVAARPHIPQRPITGGVALSVLFRIERPKSHYGSGRNAEVLRSAAPRFHAQKPDVDNLIKAVMDALSIIGIWEDDTQACRLIVEKRWATLAERPGATIDIEELE
jgi:crossover junction endodeoxyribonuclease RusA